MTSKCILCTVALDPAQGRPSADAMPCHIENCPYDGFDYEKAKISTKRIKLPGN
jgi:hypothetical protein